MHRPHHPAALRPRALIVALVAALTTLPGGITSARAATLPSISVGDVTIAEGNAGTTSVTFMVVQNVRGKTSVRFATANGTATNPDDYVSKSGTLRFSGGHRKNKVTVTIVGDTLDEPDETLFLRLSSPVGATIGDGEGQGTIADDDLPPAVSTIATLTVPEGSGGTPTFASVDVSLSAVSGREVTVDFATADGTATAGNDYDPSTGTLVFPAGQTVRSILVQVTGDDSSEGNETFDVDLWNPTNATLGARPATVTIQDNDPVPPGSAVFSVSGGSVREGDGGTTILDFTVTRSSELTTPVDVDYQTTNGTALAPSDYTTTSGNLSFTALETAKTLSVAIVGDRRLEHRERFFLSLLNPSLGGAIDVGQATGFINNDDTKTTLTVTKGTGILASGRLSPPHPKKHMIVTLYRWRNGAWRRIAVRRPLLAGATDLNADGFTDSRYGTRFTRPKPGRCRMVARFPGDTDHGASRATKTFRC
jgi:hypothetical protein